MLLEAMLAHLGAMLGYVGPAGRNLGATWRQDEAQERQDKPRWRTGAPRRGKISELKRQGLLQGGACHATGRRGRACTPLRIQNWDSRTVTPELGLQTPTPAGTGSGKLDPGKLKDWKTGPSACLYTQLCLRHGGGYFIIINFLESTFYPNYQKNIPRDLR